MAADSRVTGVPVPGVGHPVAPTPGDAMGAGIHTDPRGSSTHKRAVSSVLHLKKESGGRAKPTAYRHTTGIKAFKRTAKHG